MKPPFNKQFGLSAPKLFHGLLFGKLSISSTGPLLYMGYNLRVYHDGSQEIDFVANKGNKQYYFQVAYSVAKEKAYEREFGSFARLDNFCQKIVITNDDIVFSTSTVRHIQFRDFVKMDEL